MTTIVGPVVTEVSGEKWPGSFIASLDPPPFHCGHSIIGQPCEPATGPTPSDSGNPADTPTERSKR